MDQSKHTALRLVCATPTLLALSMLHVLGMVALRRLAMATLGGSYHFGLSIAELSMSCARIS
jgi:hypothetical protein